MLAIFNENVSDPMNLLPPRQLLYQCIASSSCGSVCSRTYSQQPSSDNASCLSVFICCLHLVPDPSLSPSTATYGPLLLVYPDMNQSGLLCGSKNTIKSCTLRMNLFQSMLLCIGNYFIKCIFVGECLRCLLHQDSQRAICHSFLQGVAQLSNIHLMKNNR